MGELGNLSPALSVEGMRERTDARRGEGVFDRWSRPRSASGGRASSSGSRSPPRGENADEILSDEVLDTFVEKLGAL